MTSAGAGRRRILVVTPAFPSDDAPIAAIYVEEQVRVLTQEYDVAVLVPTVARWRSALAQRTGRGAEIAERAGVLVCRSRAYTPLPGFPAAFYHTFTRAALRGFELLRHHWGTPALLHAHFALPAGWAAVRLGRRHGIPVVLTEHSGPFAVQLRTRLDRRLVRETLGGAARVVAVSPALGEQMRMFEPRLEVTAIGNVIRTDFFVPPRDASRRGPVTCFLTVGELRSEKGITDLLRAARLLVERGLSGFELWIAGRGPEGRRLQEMADALELSAHCHFLGLLSRADVATWMQRCDALILPSRHETFGIPAGEAMACGKPVIATRCGGPGVIVTPETGVLVEPGKPEALAGVMADFIAGRLRFDADTIRRSVAERFGAEAFLRNLSAVYDRVWSADGERQETALHTGGFG